MADERFDINDLSRRMKAAVETLRREFGGLRTGRASTALLDQIYVEVYGQRMPLNQVGTVSVPEPKTLTVQVWDKAAVSAVDRAIREANLGLNPIVDGTMLRLPLPALTAERRQELVKIAHKYAEQAKVAARKVRQDGMEKLKQLEKKSDISKDEMHKWSKDVQQLTDNTIKDIDEVLATKDKEITTV